MSSLTRDQLVDNIRLIDRLLRSEAQWTKGAVARDEDGNPVESDDPKAVRWCLLGAASKVLDDKFHYDQVVMCLLDTVNKYKISGCMLSEINDSLDFPGVKRLINEAKEIAASNDPWTPYLE